MSSDARSEAVGQLRRYASWIDENAEALLAELDEVYILDGIDFAFRLSQTEAPCVEVRKGYYVTDRRPKKW